MTLKSWDYAWVVFLFCLSTVSQVASAGPPFDHVQVWFAEHPDADIQQLVSEALDIESLYHSIRGTNVADIQRTLITRLRDINVGEAQMDFQLDLLLQLAGSPYLDQKVRWFALTAMNQLLRKVPQFRTRTPQLAFKRLSELPPSWVGLRLKKWAGIAPVAVSLQSCYRALEDLSETSLAPFLTLPVLR